jgi:hypothetical protein
MLITKLKVPLSGGIDSCSTATMVFSMCRLVIAAIEEGNEQVILDVKRLCKYSKELPKTAQVGSGSLKLQINLLSGHSHFAIKSFILFIWGCRNSRLSKQGLERRT